MDGSCGVCWGRSQSSHVQGKADEAMMTGVVGKKKKKKLISPAGYPKNNRISSLYRLI